MTGLTKDCAAGGSETTAAIDLAHLRRYTFGNTDLEYEILELFVAQAPSNIEKLQTALTHKDWFDAAHALKGAARAVGAWDLAKHAEAAERVQDAEGVNRDDYVEGVRSAFQRACSFVQTL